MMKIKNELSLLSKEISTSIRKFFGGTDYRRWRNLKNLHEAWDDRTHRIAALIKPGASVIEFGAGRLVLKTLLPAACSYTPSDLVDRGAGTIVCNLNALALPDFGRYDVAVFSGVLEYVADVSRLIRHLSSSMDVIIASYAVTDKAKKNRRANGWINDYSSDQFVAIFTAAGFACDHREEWGHQQIIYRFLNLRGVGAHNIGVP